MKISLAKSKWKKMVQYCNQCPMDIDMFTLYQRKPRQIPCLHLAYHAFSIWLKCDATNGACHAILFAVVLAVLCMPIFAWISNELPTAFAKLHCSSARVWNRHRSVLHLIPHIRKFYNTHTQPHDHAYRQYFDALRNGGGKRYGERVQMKTWR